MIAYHVLLNSVLYFFINSIFSFILHPVHSLPSLLLPSLADSPPCQSPNHSFYFCSKRAELPWGVKKVSI